MLIKIVKKIVNVLAAVDDTTSLNETCEGHTWKAELCGKSPVLCVDCIDPCSNSNSDMALVLSPCHNASSVRNIIHLLSIDYVPPKPAPTFNISHDIRNTSVINQIRLSDRGVVSCGIFSSNTPPKSINEIYLQNRIINVMSMNSTTEMTITGLQPASQYYLYCSTTSTDNVVMKWDDVLEKR